MTGVTPFTVNQEGTWFDLPEDVYRDAPGINISRLKSAPTPLHFKTAMEAKPEEPTPAQVIGTLTHRAILEPSKPVAASVKPADMDFRSKDGKAWRDAQTLPIIEESDVEAINGMRVSVNAHPVAWLVLKAAQKEVSIFKRDPFTGLMLKGRLDALTVDAQGLTTVVDVKTCEECDDRSAAKAIAVFKYDQQAAWYLDLSGATFFVLIFVEKSPPYAVRVFNLDSESIELARQRNRTRLDAIAECYRSGIWPAYPDGLTTISVPAWRKKLEGEL